MRSTPWRSALFLVATGLAVPIGFTVAHSVPAVGGGPVRPIDNDCSAGHVELTFDDGPGVHSRMVLDKLNALHLKATFFVIGENIVDGGPNAAALLREEVATGHSVQNHTYDHASITGDSTRTAPLTREQLVRELDLGTRTIVAAGVPRPTLYRPPYGDVDARADDVARELGYRVVVPWGITGTNIVDSKDWSGATTDQIVSNVVNGYDSDGDRYNGIKDQTIVVMHDGGHQDTLNSIAALQPIADYMNAHHLCSTAAIRPDATGDRVPTPPLPEPGDANLVKNPSLEKRRGGDPACFQRAGTGAGGAAAQWSITREAHTGNAAEQIVVTRPTGGDGDQKLLLSRHPSDSSCLPAVKPGRRYATWLWYRGAWPTDGASRTRVGIVTYYRDARGHWQYWQSGPAIAPADAWKLTDFLTAPLPRGATAISFGLAISGKGMVLTDDYSMSPLEKK